MGFLGLFKFKDVTRTTLTVSRMTREEFVKRISSVTDQTTNTGFLTNGKKFHGLVNNDRFRLKRIQTFRNEEFLIKGEIKSENEKLVVQLEFIRGPIQTFLPTFFFIVGTITLIQTIQKEDFDWRYIPFILIVALLFFGGFEIMKKNEIEKIKDLIQDVVKKGIE
jgi:hypothetical protein